MPVSRNGKEASVAAISEREEKPAGWVGTLWPLQELLASPELGSMWFDRITTAMVLRRDFGELAQLRKLVRMKLQQTITS